MYIPGKGEDRASLKTRSRADAERIGRELLGTLLTGATSKVRTELSLGELIEAFLTECPMYLDNGLRTQAEQRTSLEILSAAIGHHRLVPALTEHDIRQYEARRRAGGIKYRDGRISGPVRQRSVQADIKLLKQAIYWACTRTYPDGTPWLERNPIQYVRIKGERDVRRPVATFERFQATREAMRKLQSEYLAAATANSGCSLALARARAWVRAEFALFLLEATGRRSGAILGLRWEDFDFEGNSIVWRAEHDKSRTTWRVPYPDEFFREVFEFRARLGGGLGCVFARESDPTRPVARELLGQWIRTAEAKAGLPKLIGGVCHPYRRKWRSERSHHPDKAVALAGGWHDFQTMIRCYDHPAASDVLAVTGELQKRRDSVKTA